MSRDRLEKIEHLAVSLANAETRKDGWPYNYFVTQRGMRLAGFMSPSGFWRFIEERGLRCAGDFPGAAEIEGAFYRLRTLDPLPIGVETRVWQGMDYTRATITEHEGLRVVNYHCVQARNRGCASFFL